MSRFYADIQGSRGEATRQGTTLVRLNRDTEYVA